MVYDDEQILVQDRVGKSWPGITFPGGHVEPGNLLLIQSLERFMRKRVLRFLIQRFAALNNFIRKMVSAIWFYFIRRISIRVN
nr:NUDIX domain-containing protein [Piscibacillus salipiscarius]